MLKIVDWFVYEGKPSPDRFDVSVLDLAHGQREASVRRCIDWSEGWPLDPDSKAAQILRGEIDDPDAEEKALASRKASARRAKSKTRKSAKHQGLDTMLTLTYRGNQCDKDLCAVHFKAFVRRMRTVIPDFVYIAFPETQKRGAWHVHMAVRKLPVVIKDRKSVTLKSFNVIRAIWRSVVGEWGGNIDAGRKKRSSTLSAARCAAYIAKYCLKAFEDGELGSKRYWSSKGADVPKPSRMQFQAASLAELIDLVVSFATEGGRVLATSWLSTFKDCYFVAAESPG